MIAVEFIERLFIYFIFIIWIIYLLKFLITCPVDFVLIEVYVEKFDFNCNCKNILISTEQKTLVLIAVDAFVQLVLFLVKLCWLKVCVD